MIRKFRNVTISAIAIAACALLYACAKDEKTPEEEEPLPVAPAWTFNWTPAGGSVVAADSAYFVASLNNIVAFKNGNVNVIDITLSSLSPGTYSINSSTGNSLDYTYGSVSHPCTAGSVTISAHNSSHLSGSFAGAVSGSITGVSGSFSEIRAK